MSRPLAWRQLLPGVAVAAALGVVATSVLLFARVGALHGRTVELRALTDHAAGLGEGSEVWVGGQKVGRVRRVDFTVPASDTTKRLEIVLDVLDEYRAQIRRDSRAQIRPGGSLVGAPVLMVSAGTAGAAALAEGDTIATDAEKDLEGVTSRVAIASRDFPAIIGNVKTLSGQLTSATSTIGAILTSNAGGEQFAALSRSAGALARQLDAGSGTLGRTFHGDAMGRARHAAAQLDTLRALLGSAQPQAGHFRRDTTLLASVRDLRNEVSLTRALLLEPRGTAGRVVRDSAVLRELTGAEAELTALIADIKARPFRYVAF